MHGTTRARHATAENAANTLVPKTDAKNWNATREFADNGSGYAGLHWRARPGRDHDCTRLERDEIGEADRVIPDDLRLFTELAEIARNIEHEGIVIVDDENQSAPEGSAPKAWKSRCALARVSSYSVSGSDIAVIPPPA